MSLFHNLLKLKGQKMLKKTIKKTISLSFYQSLLEPYELKTCPRLVFAHVFVLSNILAGKADRSTMKFWQHLAYSEIASRFFNNLWGLWGSRFQPFEITYYIIGLREQNARLVTAPVPMYLYWAIFWQVKLIDLLGSGFFPAYFHYFIIFSY